MDLDKMNKENNAKLQKVLTLKTLTEKNVSDLQHRIVAHAALLITGVDSSLALNQLRDQAHGLLDVILDTQVQMAALAEEIGANAKEMSDRLLK